MREELVLAGYESSGIGRLMQTQSFESFSLDYYPAADRTGMEANLRTLREFAHRFDTHRGENYLLIGGTGLGKTHLSTAVARGVIDSGFDVVYDTAQGVFSAFEAAQFGRDQDAGEEKYLRCELLIMDDLGTELTNNFTVSCLYNIINTRLNNRLSTIINTNLTHSELRTRYADRITSRLFGEFRPLLFSGSDIRREKLKRGN
jgi:DNA replication protein DnaC